jgi:general secretion pathway protein D
VLAGLISDAERTTANKIPGLGDLPLLGRLFGTQKDDSAKGEIVLSITPRIVRSLKRPDADTSEFWYGTSLGKSGKPLTVESGTNGKPVAQPAVTGAAVPGSSADDAMESGLRKNPLIRRSTLLRGRKAEDIASPVPAAEAATKATEPAPQSAVPAAPVPIPVVPAPATIDGPSVAEPPAAPAGNESTAPAAPTSRGINSPGSLSWDGPPEVVVGQDFLARLNLSTSQLINGMSFQIKFDPAAMQVVSVSEGSLVQEAKLFGNFRFNVNDKTGVIDIKLDPSEGGGLNGQGDLLAVTFLPVAAREKSIVTVQALSPVGTPGQRVTLSAPGPLNIALKAS